MFSNILINPTDLNTPSFYQPKSEKFQTRHQAQLIGSFVASYHASHVAQLNEAQQKSMIEDVVGFSKDCLDQNEEIEEILLGMENAPEVVELVFTPVSSLQVDTKEATTILMNLESPKGSPKSLTKWQRQKAGRKQRAALAQKTQETQEIKEVQEVQDIQEKGTLEANEKAGNFKLQSIKQEGSSNLRDRIEDELKVGTDFRLKKLSKIEIGQRHVWKRLNFFLVMARYIADKASYLKEMDFPLSEKNQYACEAYSVPSSYIMASSDANYERAHISVIGKIAVMHHNQLYKMSGNIKVLGKETSLYKFFNTCDIVPKVLNSIDWYAEYFLRENAYRLLTDIKEKRCSYAEAAKQFVFLYGDCLKKLYKRIQRKECTSNHSRSMDEFKKEMDKIVNNKKEALDYIEGMFEAINDFIDYFQTSSNVNYDKNYPLYEKVK